MGFWRGTQAQPSSVLEDGNSRPRTILREERTVSHHFQFQGPATVPESQRWEDAARNLSVNRACRLARRMQ